MVTTKLIRGGDMPLLTGAGTAAAPTLSTDGRACDAHWKRTPRGEKYLVCLSKATGAGTVTMTAPVVLWGYRGNQWYQIKRLNAGADIVMVTSNGYSEIVDYLGIWERISMSSGAITAVHTVNASAIELQNSLVP